jgi:hypothetical protein
VALVPTLAAVVFVDLEVHARAAALGRTSAGALDADVAAGALEAAGSAVVQVDLNVDALPAALSMTGTAAGADALARLANEGAGAVLVAGSAVFRIGLQVDARPSALGHADLTRQAVRYDGKIGDFAVHYPALGIEVNLAVSDLAVLRQGTTRTTTVPERQDHYQQPYPCTHSQLLYGMGAVTLPEVAGKQGHPFPRYHEPDSSSRQAAC